MLDLLHLPRDLRADVQVFASRPANALLDWQTWIKPRGVSMLYMFALGGGGGGAGGSVAGMGGGGGGSGAQAALLIPAFCVPDVLYVQLGLGGTAGAAAGNGGTSAQTLVCIFPNSVVNNRVMQPNGGGSAASGGQAAGTGGNGATIATIADMPLAGYGLTSFLAGQVGQAGSASAPAGTDLRADAGLSLGGLGGSGNTGAPNAGAGFNAIANSLLSTSAPAAATVGNSPSSAILLRKPFYVYPGMGAPSVTGATGLNGGDGAFGAGGGGGGSAATTGGKGGRGGDGLVIIIAW